MQKQNILNSSYLNVHEDQSNTSYMMDQSIDNSMNSSFVSTYEPPAVLQNNNKKRPSFIDRLITNGVMNMLNKNKAPQQFLKNNKQEQENMPFILQNIVNQSNKITSQQQVLQNISPNKNQNFQRNSSPNQSKRFKIQVSPITQGYEKDNNVQSPLPSGLLQSPDTERVTNSIDGSFMNSVMCQDMGVCQDEDQFWRRPKLEIQTQFQTKSKGVPPYYQGRPSSRYRDQKSMDFLMFQHCNQQQVLEDKVVIFSPINKKLVEKKFVVEKLQDISKKQVKFIDDEFPPNINALCITPRKNVKFQQMNQWERANNLKNKSISLCQVRDPTCLTQGRMSNCSLVSALSTIADNRFVVQRLFEDQAVNEAGVYYVRLCKDGIWQYIIMDDYFPYDFEKQDFIFTSQKPENFDKCIDFWAALIEKAYTKAYGTYQDFELSKTPLADIFRSLTGVPVETLELNNFYGVIEDLLAEGINNNYILMVTNESSPSQNELCSQNGIPANYSFQVLGANNNMIQLYNPFGWQENTEFGIPRDENGFFYLKKDQFISLFHQLLICQIDSNNYYCARNTRHLLNSYSILEFSKKEHGLCSFETHQMDKRLFRSYGKNKYDYTMARLILCQKDEKGEFKYLLGACSQEKVLSMEAELSPGTYRLLLVMDWKDARQIYDVNVSYYGLEKIKLSRKNFKDHPNLIGDVMINESKENGKRFKKQNIYEYAYASENERLLTIVFENRSSKSYVHKKDFSFIDPTKLQLLTVLNKEQENFFSKISSKEVNQIRQSGGMEWEFELKSRSCKSIVFKLMDKDLVYNSKLLKKLGIN